MTPFLQLLTHKLQHLKLICATPYKVTARISIKMTDDLLLQHTALSQVILVCLFVFHFIDYPVLIFEKLRY